jgi:tetratricopeptide (TPR) repeat protein
MSANLRDLSASDLKRLGGLREQCSAPLACSEHGAPHPCEYCKLEGLLSLSCTACGHQFAQGLSSVTERPCASGAEFASTGRIAFETEAVATLAKEQAEQERDRERERKRHQRETRARAEAERRRERERAEAARLAEEERAHAADIMARAESESRGESVESIMREVEALAESRSQIALLGSGAAALIGAVMAWRLPLVPLPSTSWLYLILVYAPVVLMAWAIGAAPLYGKEVAHRSLRWWSALPWAIFCFAWPALIGLGACYLISEIFSDGAYFKALLFVSLVTPIGVTTMIFGGVAFSMDKPWPKGFQPNFKGKRSWWLWLGVILTVSLNLVLWQGQTLPLPAAASPLLPLLGSPSSSSSRSEASGICIGKPNPAECVRGQLGRNGEPSPDDLRAAASQSLGQVAAAVNSIDDLGKNQSQTVLPAVDAAIKMINKLPRPQRGNRRTARALLTQGMNMFTQNGNAAEAVVLLKRAHQTDPLDIQIVNDLAYVQMKNGQLDEAEDNLLFTLMLAPKRTIAWANLAQLRTTSAPNDERAIEEAARYMVVAYWFSNDRVKTVNFINQQIKSGNGSTPFALACKKALEKIGAAREVLSLADLEPKTLAIGPKTPSVSLGNAVKAIEGEIDYSYNQALLRGVLDFQKRYPIFETPEGQAEAQRLNDVIKNKMDQFN